MIAVFGEIGYSICMLSEKGSPERRVALESRSPPALPFSERRENRFIFTSSVCHRATFAFGRHFERALDRERTSKAELQRSGQTITWRTGPPVGESHGVWSTMRLG